MYTNRFLEKFGIKDAPENIDAYYAAARSEFALHGEEILDFERYNIFTYMRDDIARIADAIRRDCDLVIYCYLLNAAIRADDLPAINALSAPRAADGSEVYDSLSLFALMWELPKMLGQHRRRRVPEDVTAATLEMFQNQVGDFVKLHGYYIDGGSIKLLEEHDGFATYEVTPSAENCRNNPVKCKQKIEKPSDLLGSSFSLSLYLIISPRCPSGGMLFATRYERAPVFRLRSLRH